MSDTRRRFLLSSIVVFGLLFRVAFLFDPYRVDEVYTFFNFARFPLSQIASLYSNTNNHFLHSMLVHVCYRVMGLSELSLRLPAFLCGMAVIYATYRVGLRLQDDPIVAVVASCFVATSSTFLLYSVYSRGYMLQTAIALIVTLMTCRENAFESWWDGPLILAVGGFLVMYAVPSGIIFVLPIYLWFFMRPTAAVPGPARTKILVSAIVCLLLVAGAFLRLVSQFPALAAYNAYPIGNVRFLTESASLTSAGVLPVPLFLGVIALGIYTFNGKGRWLLLFVSLFYLGAALLVSRVAVQFRFFPRSYVVIFPFLYVLAAKGVVSAIRKAVSFPYGRGLAWTGIAGLIGYGAATTSHLVTHKAELEQGDPNRFYYRQLIKPLSRRLRDGEIIQGTDSLSDSMAAIYTVEERGFSGHYGLGNLQKEPVQTIYLVGPDRESVARFFEKNLAGDGWSTPVPGPDEGPMVAFRTDKAGRDRETQDSRLSTNRT